MTVVSLEEMLTGRDYFGPGFGPLGGAQATPLQIAICRIIEGRPLGELLTHPDVVFAVGDYRPCDGIRPKAVYVVSGARTGKSLTAGATVTHASQTCDVSRLGPGEVPRASVLSLDRDKAQVVVDHCLGNIRRSPKLASKILGRPLKASFTIKHPEGRAIEIAVVAGAGAGGSVVSRWSAGCVFDEAARMTGDDEGSIVNFDETVRAVEGRLLEGAQIIAITSPAAPRGPIYRAVQQSWRKPTRELVVIKAPAWMMNPVWWTPERIASLSPEARRTDAEAEFADRDHSLYGHFTVERCMRKAPPGVSLAHPRRRWTYVAALDPGTRGPRWNLVVLGADVAHRWAERWVVVEHAEWCPKDDRPISVRETLTEIKAKLARYNLEGAWTDQWAPSRIADVATELELGLWHKTLAIEDRFEGFESLRVLLESQRIELPNDPDFRDDLLNVRRRLVAGGPVIETPTSSGGRHANYARLLALACAEASAVVPEAEKKDEEAEIIDRLEREARRPVFSRAVSRTAYWRR
jgi:hypothetical protein